MRAVLIHGEERIVVNVVLACSDPEFVYPGEHDEVVLVDDDIEVGPRYTYDGANFLPPPPAPEQTSKALKHAAVTARREAVFAAGFTPSTGPLAGHTLQVRDESDKINWLTSSVSYSAAVAAGHGASLGATFRTTANETVVVTFAEGLAVIVQQMAAWGQAIMLKSWALKDQIDAAADDAALEAIDIDAGWPE